MAKTEGSYIELHIKMFLAISQPILDRFLWFKDQQLGKYVCKVQHMMGRKIGCNQSRPVFFQFFNFSTNLTTGNWKFSEFVQLQLVVWSVAVGFSSISVFFSVQLIQDNISFNILIFWNPEHQNTSNSKHNASTSKKGRYSGRTESFTLSCQKMQDIWEVVSQK